MRSIFGVGKCKISIFGLWRSTREVTLMMPSLRPIRGGYLRKMCVDTNFCGKEVTSVKVFRSLSHWKSLPANLLKLVLMTFSPHFFQTFLNFRQTFNFFSLVTTSMTSIFSRGEFSRGGGFSRGGEFSKKISRILTTFFLVDQIDFPSSP